MHKLFLKNFSIKTKTYVVFSLLGLGACSGNPSQNPNGSPEIEPFVTALQVRPGFEALHVALKPLAEPHQYQVTINAPQDFSSLKKLNVEVWKLSSISGEKPALVETAVWYLSVTQIFDTQLLAEDYDYELRLKTEDDAEVLRSRVHVPVDVVFDKVTELQQSLQVYGRLFLLEGARLQSGGRNLSIEAHKLISNGGAIESFDPESSAALNMAARSSGNVTLKFGEAQGKLFVRINGEKGATGLTGEDSQVQGPGGAEGSNGSMWHGSLRDMDSNSCNSYGSRGGDGQPGGAGGTGHPGARGGDLENVFIQINKRAQSGFELVQDLSPGLGGDGGVGGRGGPPGQPGRGSTLCGGGNGRPGPWGATGPTGSRGLSGMLMGKTCVIIEGSESGQCSL